MAGVLVLLLPSFVIFFAPRGGPSSGQSLTIPTIRGKEAPVSEYMRAYNAAMTAVKFQYGNRQEALNMFRPQIQQQAAQWMLLWREAEKLGIDVSLAEIRKQVEAMPEFRNEAGQYDYYRYTGFLGGRDIKEEDYGNFLRGQTAIDRLYEMITQGIVLTPAQIRQDYDASYEKYRVELVQFKAEDFKSKVTVPDADAQKHFEENKDKFKMDAQAKVRYALFGFDALQKQVTVSDDDVKKYFEQNASAYTKEDGSPKSFDEVKSQIHDILAKRKARELAGNNATQFTVDLKPDTGEAPKFADLAAKFGAVVRETPYFGPTNTVEGVQAGSTFNRAGLALNPNYPHSQEIEGTDGFYVLEFVDGKPSRPSTFEEAKAQIVDTLTAQKSLNEARKIASETNQKFKDGLAAGKTFAQTAETLGLKVVKPELFSMMEGGADIANASLIRDVARRTPPGSVSDTIYTSDGAVVFHLIERISPTDEQFQKDKETITSRLQTAARQDAWRRWVNKLISDAQVRFGNEPQSADAN